MFTGIVGETGIVRKFGLSGGIYRIDIGSKDIADDVDIGGSVAVNGVCLTVTSVSGGVLGFDVMEETIRKTSLAELKPGERVNLEGSLRADGSLGGHFVLGHIDCVGRVASVLRNGPKAAVRIEFPAEYGDLLVEKGSIAIDGVSLTVGEVSDRIFTVFLIPHTIRSTTLDSLKAGRAVNLEFDIIGKYAARQNSRGGRPRISEDFLREKGF